MLSRYIVRSNHPFTLHGKASLYVLWTETHYAIDLHMLNKTSVITVFSIGILSAKKYSAYNSFPEGLMSAFNGSLTSITASHNSFFSVVVIEHSCSTLSCVYSTDSCHRKCIHSKT